MRSNSWTAEEATWATRTRLTAKGTPSSSSYSYELKDAVLPSNIRVR
jgi:hypothetical protein